MAYAHRAVAAVSGNNQPAPAALRPTLPGGSESRDKCLFATFTPCSYNPRDHLARINPFQFLFSTALSLEWQSPSLHDKTEATTKKGHQKIQVARASLKVIERIQRVCLEHLDFGEGAVCAVRLDNAEALHNRHAPLYPSEYCVFAFSDNEKEKVEENKVRRWWSSRRQGQQQTIQPLRGGQCNEELAAICVRPAVGHRENACARVLERRVDFVLKLGSAVVGGGVRRARRGAGCVLRPHTRRWKTRRGPSQWGRPSGP